MYVLLRRKSFLMVMCMQQAAVAAEVMKADPAMTRITATTRVAAVAAAVVAKYPATFTES